MRRVPGLRREEVAQIASISVDYYTRLEQGRLHASTSVLETLARALRLDGDQRAYLYELAGKTDGRKSVHGPQRVRPQLQRVLDQLTESPALVLGRFLDILAWNGLASAVFTDFAKVADKERNWLRLVFTNPQVRSLYAEDWKESARTCVAFLRMDAARDPKDPRLAALLEALNRDDPDFRRWWAAHHVRAATSGTKILHHQDVGELVLDWDVFSCANDADQRLVVMTAEPGTPSHDALRILAGERK